MQHSAFPPPPGWKYYLSSTVLDCAVQMWEAVTHGDMAACERLQQNLAYTVIAYTVIGGGQPQVALGLDKADEAGRAHDEASDG